jgi:uncharacterized membrane protein YtjA (UPF0391 family)
LDFPPVATSASLFLANHHDRPAFEEFWISLANFSFFAIVPPIVIVLVLGFFSGEGREQRAYNKLALTGFQPWTKSSHPYPNYRTSSGKQSLIQHSFSASRFAGGALRSKLMLRYAIIFLIIALIAEAFGAGGVAGEASWIAHVLLVIAVVFIIYSFVTGRRGPPAV